MITRNTVWPANSMPESRKRSSSTLSQRYVDTPWVIRSVDPLKAYSHKDCLVCVQDVLGEARWGGFNIQATYFLSFFRVVGIGFILMPSVVRAFIWAAWHWFFDFKMLLSLISYLFLSTDCAWKSKVRLLKFDLLKLNDICLKLPPFGDFERSNWLKGEFS